MLRCKKLYFENWYGIKYISNTWKNFKILLSKSELLRIY